MLGGEGLFAFFMTITKTSIKKYSEFPYLAFIYSNKGKMEETYKKAFQKINQAIDLFCQQYPGIAKNMNHLFWGENEDSSFRFPIAILKNKFSFLDSSTFLQKKQVTNIGQCTLSAEIDIQIILKSYRIHFIVFEAWTSQKETLFKEFENHEYIQTVSFIKQFIHDTQNLFGRGNLSYIIGGTEYAKYSHLAKNLSAVFTQKKIPSRDNPCSHQKVDIVTTKGSSTASCHNCIFQATFNPEKNEWVSALPCGFMNHIEDIKGFYKKIDDINLISIPFIQFVISLPDFLDKVPFEEYQNFQKFIPALQDETFFIDIQVPKEPDTLYLYKKVHNLNIPHVSQYPSVVQWVENINLAYFKELYNKQDRYLSLLQELRSTDTTTLLDSWNQYAAEVKRILEEARKHVPSQLIIRNNFTLVKEEIIPMFSLIKELDGGFGLTTIADTLRGAKTKKMREYGLDKSNMYGSLSHRKSLELKEALAFLVKKNFAVQVGDDYPKLKLTKKGLLYSNLIKNGSSVAAQENKEKEQFLQKPFDVFLANLQNPAIENGWKMEYIQRKMEGNEVCIYRDLVLYAATHRDSIPFMEPILLSYFKEQYIPVFQMYTRTRKNSHFAKMIESILAHKEVMLC